MKSTLFALSMLLASVAPAIGQNSNDFNAFDFSLPGARSRGIGGAFVAIADDATSVYSNPAGLGHLFRPEVAIEGRIWGISSSIPNTGHAFGVPSGIGIDTVAGVQNRRWTSDTAGLSFLSFVYPGDRWAVGVFRHQMAHYDMSRRPQGTFFNCTGGFRGETPSPPYCEPHAQVDGVDRVFPKQQTYNLSIHSIGSSLAYDLNNRVSVGATIQRLSFQIHAQNQVFSSKGLKKYEPADFSPENLEIESTQSGSDTAWAANVGTLVELTRTLAVGASFRQGPRFAFQARTVTGPANGLGAGVVVADEPANPYRVPDTYAAGIVYRPSTAWRVSFEYDRVLFGQLIKDFREVSTLKGDPEGQLLRRQIRLDNADQLRLGAEYAAIFSNGSVIALRGGVWRDPQHQMYFESNPTTGLPAPGWALLFPKGSTDTHVSSGIGFVVGRHLQVDAAVDLSHLIDTFALSGVWRF